MDAAGRPDATHGRGEFGDAREKIVQGVGPLDAAENVLYVEVCQRIVLLEFRHGANLRDLGLGPSRSACAILVFADGVCYVGFSGCRND